MKIKEIVLRQCNKLCKSIKKLDNKKLRIGLIIAVGLFLLLAVIIYAVQRNKKPAKIKNDITIVSDAKTETSNVNASPGEKVTWQKSLKLNYPSDAVDGSIIEEIDDNQEFNGQLNLPKGWTAEYSIDSRSTAADSRVYSSTLPNDPTTVTFIKIKTGTTDDLNPVSQKALIQPLDERQLITNGNSPSSPIIYNDKVFIIYKAVRATTSSVSMDCFDLKTYASCSDVTFPTYLSKDGTNEVPTALGTGTRNISTPKELQHVLDTDTGKLYIPGQSGNNYGVTCINLSLFQNCGFTILGSSTEPTGSNPALISGFVKSGTKLYGHANDADQTYQTMVCFDLATNASCSGYIATSNAATRTYLLSEHAGSYETTGKHVMSGDKIYWLVNYRTGNTRILDIIFGDPFQTQRDLGTRLACYDVVLNQVCTGWPGNGGPVAFYTGVGIERPYGLFIWKNPGGTDKGICLSAGLFSGVDPGIICRNLSTGATLSSPSAPSLFPAQWLFTPWTMSSDITNITNEADGHQRSYFALYKTADAALTSARTGGATICYDWDKPGLCDDFPKIKYWNEINDGNSGDVGYAAVGSCMWSIGASGYVWTYNKTTAESPCRTTKTTQTVSLNADDFYCDGNTHSFNWKRAKLSNASMYDFQNYYVTVKNSAGQILIQRQDIKELGYLDLSSIPYAGNEQLIIDVESTVYNTSPWANGNLPYATVVADADEAQYCYETNTKSYCDIAGIASLSSAVVNIPDDSLIDNIATEVAVDQPAQTQCFKDVKLSITKDRTNITRGDNITYSLNIQNKANIDPESRGNIAGATVEATIPSGLTYVSSSAGGSVEGNKVVWNNQVFAAASSYEKTVTFKVPATGFVPQEKSKRGVVYAATSQQPVSFSASILYAGDTYQSDNSSVDTGVVLSITTTDPQTPTPITTDPQTPTPITADPQTPTPITADPTTNETTPVPQTATSSGSRPTPYTPLVIQRFIPSALEAPTEFIFRAFNVGASAVPASIAKASPFLLIGILIGLAIFYGIQTLIQRRLRLEFAALKERFKQTEIQRKKFIDLSTHYLNTPIVTMKSTVELLEFDNTISKETSSAMDTRLKKLSQDVSTILEKSQKTEISNVLQARTIEDTSLLKFIKKRAVIIPAVSILILAIFVNTLFVWTKKYTINPAILSTQLVVYVVGAVGLLITYRNLFQQRLVTSFANQELNLEKEVFNAQTSLIREGSGVIQDDILEIDRYAQNIQAVPKGKTFSNGLSSIKYIVSKMAFLSAIETQTTAIAMDTAQFEHIVSETVEKYRDFAQSKQIRFSTRIQPDITAQIDGVSLMQLLSSLMDNAIKFSKAGDSIDVEVNADKKETHITVSDTGEGIEAQAKEKIFAPFSRASDTQQLNYEGLGLSLYTDKIITDKYNGTIAVAENPGGGTIVRVALQSKIEQ